MEEVGQLSQTATADLERSDAAGKGFRGRLAVLAALAHSLSDPADRFYATSEKYAADLASVDAGVLTLIRLADEGAMRRLSRSS
jgi:hypothetical protein